MARRRIKDEYKLSFREEAAHSFDLSCVYKSRATARAMDRQATIVSCELSRDEINPMATTLSLTGLALLLFASTNLDDIFILVGFFADRRYLPRDVVVGQFGGIALLFGVSVTGALLSVAVPKPYIGVLGLLPVFIGCRGVWNLAHRSDGSEESPEHRPDGSTWGKAVSVALVTISSGADNLAVYIPSFALRSHRELFVVGIVFIAMTALWCLLAHRIVSHPTLGAPLRRHGHRIAPVVLICLGGFILYQAGTLRLLTGR